MTRVVKSTILVLVIGVVANFADNADDKRKIPREAIWYLFARSGMNYSTFQIGRTDGLIFDSTDLKEEWLPFKYYRGYEVKRLGKYELIQMCDTAGNFIYLRFCPIQVGAKNAFSKILIKASLCDSTQNAILNLDSLLLRFAKSDTGWVIDSTITVPGGKRYEQRLRGI